MELVGQAIRDLSSPLCEAEQLDPASAGGYIPLLNEAPSGKRGPELAALMGVDPQPSISFHHTGWGVCGDVRQQALLPLLEFWFLSFPFL